MDPGTYVLPSTRSLKRLGLRGDVVAMLDSPEDTLRLAGTESGAAEIELGEIDEVLVGIVFNKISDYRTTIRSAGRRPILLSGRFPNQYSAFVADLAIEMERIGRIDRVRCGVPFILSWGPFFVLVGLALVAAGLYAAATAMGPEPDLLVPIGVAAGGLIMAALAVHHYLRWERPRQAAGAEEVRPYLPAG